METSATEPRHKASHILAKAFGGKNVKVIQLKIAANSSTN